MLPVSASQIAQLLLSMSMERPRTHSQVRQSLLQLVFTRRPLRSQDQDHTTSTIGATTMIPHPFDPQRELSSSSSREVLPIASLLLSVSSSISQVRPYHWQTHSQQDPTFVRDLPRSLLRRSLVLTSSRVQSTSMFSTVVVRLVWPTQTCLTTSTPLSCASPLSQSLWAATDWRRSQALMSFLQATPVECLQSPTEPLSHVPTSVSLQSLSS
jgi:hypothetical protein